jgi:hypothetical protein
MLSVVAPFVNVKPFSVLSKTYLCPTQQLMVPHSLPR